MRSCSDLREIVYEGVSPLIHESSNCVSCCGLFRDSLMCAQDRRKYMADRVDKVGASESERPPLKKAEVELNPTRRCSTAGSTL
jgi:hypothetical protein